MSGGFAALDQVLSGIDAAIAAGLTPVKINAVIERGVNDHTALDLVERFRGSPVIVRFIEFMDVGNRNALAARDGRAVARTRRAHQARWPMQPISENYRGEVAQRWRFDDGAGEVGFISSVSQPFCGACSRARLSSEGKFYTCLFATQGLDLRAPLRAGASDAESAAIDPRRGWGDAPIATANCARNCGAPSRGQENRDVLHRRLKPMTFTHLDAERHPTMVDVSDKTPTKRTAPPRRACDSRRGRRGAARQRLALAERARYSIRPSSPASWAPSAPTN
jgi:hypothetical protein